jgi:hypothetical protein
MVLVVNMKRIYGELILSPSSGKKVVTFVEGGVLILALHSV